VPHEINLTHPLDPSRRTIAFFAKNFLPLLTATRTVTPTLTTMYGGSRGGLLNPLPPSDLAILLSGTATVLAT
jgi:hypothetical protein